MGYKYITENNLYDRQNYMYSQYLGMEFLREYVKSRKLKNSTAFENGWGSEQNSGSTTRARLEGIHDRMHTTTEIPEELNRFVKAFEVRKRLYAEYDNWKPVETSTFEDYESYISFAECLIEAYGFTNNLKYFSCLLKVDDMLLSVQDKLTGSQMCRLKKIVESELGYFDSMLEKHKISMEAEL